MEDIIDIYFCRLREVGGGQKLNNFRATQRLHTSSHPNSRTKIKSKKKLWPIKPHRGRDAFQKLEK
jgi:hypothetical protein